MKFERRKRDWMTISLIVILFVLIFFIGFYLGKYTSIGIVLGPESHVPAQVVALPVNVVSYACSNSKIIIAKYYQGESKPSLSSDLPPIPGGSVDLTLGDGRSMTLPQTISADGTRYANIDESIVFWSKGKTAFITEGNLDNTTYKNCTIISQTAKP